MGELKLIQQCGTLSTKCCCSSSSSRTIEESPAKRPRYKTSLASDVWLQPPSEDTELTERVKELWRRVSQEGGNECARVRSEAADTKIEDRSEKQQVMNFQK